MNRKMNTFTFGRVISLVEKEMIDLNVWYQRQSGKWTAAKQGEFIGDVLNNFSPGVLFYHRFTDESNKVLGQVDGKQRVTITIGFKAGTVRLPKDFVYEKNPSYKIGGMSWQELEEQGYQDVIEDFLNKEIHAELLITDDLTKVYEQFIKLNSGKKLQPAEIRHAFPGMLMEWVRNKSKDKFFDEKMGFGNGSYEYEDLVIKLLYMEIHGKPMNLHSQDLNVFAHKFSAPKRDQLKVLRAAMRSVEDVLDLIDQVFHSKSSILSKLNYVPSAYWLMRDIFNGKFGWSDVDMRAFFDQFSQMREDNKKKADPRFYRNQALNHYSSLLVQGLIKEDGIRDRYTILYRFAQKFTEEGSIDVNTEIFIKDLITYKDSELYIVQSTVAS